MERSIIIAITAVAFIVMVILAAYLWYKKHFSFTEDNIIFIMTLPRGYSFIGIADIIGFGIGCIFCIIDLDVFAFLIFYCFVLLGVYICIIGFLWRGVIATDSLTFYTPFLPVKKIKVHEITSVKYTENRTGAYGNGRKVLEGYHQQKKLFYVDETYKGFDLLHYLFEQSGKMERIPLVENFSVTAKKSNIICSVIAFLFFFVLWLLMLLVRNELELFYQIILTFMMLLALEEVIKVLLWRVTLDFHTLSFRNSFGIVKKYEIRQITGIVEEKDHIILYAGRQKIVKISKDLKNFDYLLERLGNIPLLSCPPGKK